MWRHYNVILENSDITKRPWQRLAIGDNWNNLMRLRDMKRIGFKHQRENKQNSDNKRLTFFFFLNERTFPSHISSKGVL
jgi:hypothetical protein